MKIQYILFVLLFALSLNAIGILGKKAPSFNVDTWLQTNGNKHIDIEDYKGKVLYLYGFQSWCPACHSHGFPTIKKLSQYYKNDNNISFVTIQTTFEGYMVNTQLAAKVIIKKYNLTMPVGHSKRDEDKPNFMDNYKTGGTPWIILVDKKGIVRFNNFHATPEELIDKIDYLNNES